MAGFVDSIFKISDDEKYKHLILLISSIVPGICYIYNFHNDLIFSLDWIKLLMVSFAFSTPFLIASFFSSLFQIRTNKGVEILKDKKENFLTYWLTVDVLIFFGALFASFLILIREELMKYILEIEETTVQGFFTQEMGFWLIYFIIIVIVPLLSKRGE